MVRESFFFLFCLLSIVMVKRSSVCVFGCVCFKAFRFTSKKCVLSTIQPRHVCSIFSLMLFFVYNFWWDRRSHLGSLFEDGIFFLGNFAIVVLFSG